MLKSLFRGVGLALVVVSAQSASAASWTLDGDNSKLAFGSIKKDSVGEVHSFESLSGTVDGNGTVDIRIDLPSVETFIDIRNERMIEHLFKHKAEARLYASVDMAQMEALPVAATSLIDVTGKLTFLGREIPVETEMFVARLSENKVIATTNEMMFLGIEDAGLTEGVDVLQSLAKLSGITRTVPVTLRLVFEGEGRAAQTDTVQSQQVAAVGDAAAGKKVFRKCKACHSLEPGKSSVGPSLHAIIGTAAGTSADFKYSKALKGSGLTWSEDQLAAFLADPKGTVPKNKMSFAGLKKSSDIENVIAYIREQG